MSHIDNGFRSLSLKRFPETDDVNPLLAWEAADEYLLQQLDDTEISGPVLILNDTFGALGCALAEHTPYSIGDLISASLPHVRTCVTTILPSRASSSSTVPLTIRRRRAWC